MTSLRAARLFALAFLFVTLARADQVDDFVNAYMAKKQIPAVAIMVRANGMLVRTKAYGLANLEHRVPATEKTVFQSGSMGKQFTAMLVCMLAEEGKLALDAPLSKYLDTPREWSGITIRHLLTHTSGLGDYPEDFSLQRDYTEDDLWKMISAQKLAFAPGSKWSYSNLGYVTLGIVIHKVSGKFYGDLLQERIFQNMGMKATRIISEADVIPNRAAGYELKPESAGSSKLVLKNQSWVSPSLNTTADGSLYLTIDDLAKWDFALDDRRFVARAMYDEIWSPVKLSGGTETSADYGFGWSLRTLPSGEKIVEHGGAWQGFASYIGRYLGTPGGQPPSGTPPPSESSLAAKLPMNRLSVAVLGNRAGADVRYIASVVAGMYRPELAPPKHAAIKLPAAELAAFAGEYRLDERVTVTVSVAASGDRLALVFTGTPRELLPEKSDAAGADFFEPDSSRTYRFERDPASGAVTGLVISVPEKLQFRRVK
jgi:CubicO group peptidase (beta-lactamase class C family)